MACNLALRRIAAVLTVLATAYACSRPATTDAGGDISDLGVDTRDAVDDVAGDTSLPCDANDTCPRRPPTVPFSMGPYGNLPRNIAGDFTVPTTDGDWNFRSAWTGDDSFLFLTYAPGYLRFANGMDYFSVLFAQDIVDLLVTSPRNVHFVFMWYRDEPGFQRVRTTWTDAVNALPAADRDHWLSRIHWVTTRVDQLETGSWVGELVRYRLRTMLPYKRYDPFQWAIDRTQRVREVGQLGRLATGGLNPQLAFLAHEAEYYNFEVDRERSLTMNRATVVDMLRDERVTDTRDFEAVLPSAPDMAGFDTLEVDLTNHCENHRDGECGAWDYLSHLWICDDPAGGGADAGADGSVDAPTDATGATDADDVSPDAVDAAADVVPTDTGPPPLRCDTEIARWITSYWREGRWVTDISGMLPFLRAGGRQRFRFYASRQFDPRPAQYVVSLSLRFSNRARGMRPVDARRVLVGGNLDTMYNTNHTPVSFTVPAGIRRVDLYALVTGHGGEPVQNCAEFCNHQHHFVVNGTDNLLQFPEARSLDGCANRVDAGVVPNQHGTWYFGRGGWCPGLDVAPYVVDVTRTLRSGMPNDLNYRATIGGAPPVRPSGNIVMSAYLVFWQ